jgi:FtsZ-binding cell division protein ZapB
MDSDRARQLQSDIVSGMKEIGTQMQSALKAIQEDDRLRTLAERGQQAISQAQESQTAKDFQEALTRGISQLNDQMAAFVSRLQSSSGDSATTGATTKLDDDK